MSTKKVSTAMIIVSISILWLLFYTLHNCNILIMYVREWCIGIVYSFVFRSPWRWWFNCWNL